MSTQRTRPVRDRLFLFMLAVTLGLVVLVFVSNSRDALRPELAGLPRIDVKRVLERIEGAGLEPQEAMYYRAVE